jgi:hypothetical protein
MNIPYRSTRYVLKAIHACFMTFHARLSSAPYSEALVAWCSCRSRSCKTPSPIVRRIQFNDARIVEPVFFQIGPRANAIDHHEAARCLQRGKNAIRTMTSPFAASSVAIPLRSGALAEAASALKRHRPQHGSSIPERKTECTRQKIATSFFRTPRGCGNSIPCSRRPGMIRLRLYRLSTHGFYVVSVKRYARNPSRRIRLSFPCSITTSARWLQRQPIGSA